MRIPENVAAILKQIRNKTENLEIVTLSEELAQACYLTGAEDVLKVVNEHIKQQIETKH